MPRWQMKDISAFGPAGTAALSIETGHNTGLILRRHCCRLLRWHGNQRTCGGTMCAHSNLESCYATHRVKVD